VGLLFGCERIGLTAAQVRLGDRICRVPTWPDCPSMNLSHAVGLFAWELNQAAGSVGELPAEPPATWAEKRLALDKLGQALQALELRPEGRRQALLLGLKEFLDRRAMSQGDAKYVLQGLNLLIKRLVEERR
jgi:tRNA/rRNA methyltransferase